MRGASIVCPAHVGMPPTFPPTFDPYLHLQSLPLQPHLESLRKYTYGKHIVNKVEALLAAQAQAEAGPTAAAEPGAPMPLPLPLAVAAEQ